MSRSVMTRRAPMLLFSVFGGVALVSRPSARMSVLAFGVSQRTRELGIRQALGAKQPQHSHVDHGTGVRDVPRRTVIGLAGAFALSQLLRSQLFGVGPGDPLVMAGATLLLLAVTTAACSIPAWRATKLAPSDALRRG
ncbi:MAG: hypothetical protein QM736_19335 [Vicinamibacterales bacterium]